MTATATTTVAAAPARGRGAGTSPDHHSPELPKIPASISKSQRKLWEKVFPRRRGQLKRLGLASLESIFGLVEAPGGDDGGKDRSRKKNNKPSLPHLRPNGASQFRQNLEYLIAFHFYASVDESVDQSRRQSSLESVKRLFLAIDAERARIAAEKAAAAKKGGRSGSETSSGAREETKKRPPPDSSSASGERGGDGGSGSKRPRLSDDDAAASVEAKKAEAEKRCEVETETESKRRGEEELKKIRALEEQTAKKRQQEQAAADVLFARAEEARKKKERGGEDKEEGDQKEREEEERRQRREAKRRELQRQEEERRRRADEERKKKEVAEREALLRDQEEAVQRRIESERQGKEREEELRKTRYAEAVRKTKEDILRKAKEAAEKKVRKAEEKEKRAAEEKHRSDKERRERAFEEAKKKADAKAAKVAEGRKKRQQQPQAAATSTAPAAMGAKLSLSGKASASTTVTATATSAADASDSDSDDDIIIIDNPEPRTTPAATSSSVASTSAGAAAAVSKARKAATTKAEPEKAASPPIPSLPAVARSKPPPRRPRRRVRPPNMPGPVTLAQGTVRFLPDTGTPSTPSSSLKPRGPCTIRYLSGIDRRSSAQLQGSTLDTPLLDAFHDRLEDWDPYWNVVHDFTVSPDDQRYEVGIITTPVAQCEHLTYGEPPQGVAEACIQLRPEEARRIARTPGRPVPWGASRSPVARTYQDGERRCIVRMLPLHLSDKDKKKRADAHLWPKGTFVQVGGRVVSALPQRKQQSHDASLWKGMCHVFDVTPLVRDPTRKTDVQLCTRDAGSYALQIAICDYISYERLFTKMIGDYQMGIAGTLRTLTYREGVDVAMKHLEASHVVIDDSDDEGASSGDKGGPKDKVESLTLSLLCQVSGKAMETPVRGQDCRHLQCFDLKTWLHNNAIVSGGRWRCALCETWVCPRNLVRCGLFDAMLDKHRGDVSGERDKVSFRSDGTWELMNANRLKYNNKKRGGDDAGSTGGEAKRGKSDGGARLAEEQEVIDID
mmetsp:Transcript_35567/g.106155  ORF Transcript_35567/g.106155 Transcript_35567/m.106155 type:complete len:1015 (-) Transcript_35567:602-3646(-)